MADVVNKALGFLGGEFQRQGMEVHVDLPAHLTIAGDADLLYRAFYNIMVNAQQAVSGPGHIHISGRRLDDGRTELDFRDTGPGFPPEDLNKPLDPFYTTKDTGTGLGLPIVQSIITSHGGTLELFNAPEGGAIIRVAFPPTSARSGS